MPSPAHTDRTDTVYGESAPELLHKKMTILLDTKKLKKTKIKTNKKITFQANVENGFPG